MTISSLYALFKRFPVISTDTRKIKPDSIFFALKGDQFNGNLFANQALELGAKYAVVDQRPDKDDERLILVDDVLACLQELAAYHRDQLKIPVLAITGSNGKTTTKELIASVLSQKYSVYATKGNLNNHIGVPLTLLEITDEIDIAVVEMGANHQGEIEQLCQIAQPTQGLITNIGHAHLEGFGGYEGVKKGKSELYRYLHRVQGQVFVNASDPVLLELLGTPTQPAIYYGMEEENSHQLRVFGKSASQNTTSESAFLSVSWKTALSDFWHEVDTNLVGQYNLSNILAAVAVGLNAGLSPAEINKGLAAYFPMNQRSQLIKTEAGNTVICDYYNANASSMTSALAHFKTQKHPSKALILGDMFELGEHTDSAHKLVIQEALGTGADQIILVGHHFYAQKLNFPDKRLAFFPDVTTAQEFLAENMPVEALILVKGSRGMALENLMPGL